MSVKDSSHADSVQSSPRSPVAGDAVVGDPGTGDAEAGDVLSTWHETVAASGPDAKSRADGDAHPALVADLREVFEDFEPTESGAGQGGASPQSDGETHPNAPTEMDGDAPGSLVIADGPVVGLHGEEAEAFMAQWQVVERSSRRDWFPVVVVAVVIGLWAIGSSGILQAAWHEVRQYQVQRRLERPRAGKSWTEQNRVNGQAPDLRPERAPPTPTPTPTP